MSLSRAGESWLFPLVDGQPPIGWDDASRYLVLPVLLVAFQFISTAIISPPVQQEEEEKNGALQKVLTVGLPFMVGWFALNLPAGLSLYYFSNITLTSAQQIWLRKLGGQASSAQGLMTTFWQIRQMVFVYYSSGDSIKSRSGILMSGISLF